MVQQRVLQFLIFHLQNMISPRTTYINLLKYKKCHSKEKAREIYLGTKNVGKTSDSSMKKTKGYLISREKSADRFKKIQKRGHSINQIDRQAASRFEGSITRRFSNKKNKTDIFSRTLTTNRENHEQQYRKNKQGENCRLVVKSNGEGQKNYFMKVNDISDVRKYLFECYPRAKNFKTIPREISLEFLLTQSNISGQFLNGQTLYFKAQYDSEDSKKSQSKSISLQDFEILKQLGSGGFSKVFLCRSKIDNNFYAIKLIEKQMVIKNQKKGIIMNERNIMVKSKHSLVIELKYAFQTEKYIAFVLEYCPGGELFGLLKKYGRLTEDVAKFYIIQVLLGLSYLHSEKVVYRDIKPENILLGIDGHIKIADLGLAKPDMHTGRLAHSFCGSPQYMSPEMILQVGHTYPVDFYCVGALLYELLTGLPPYYSQDPNQIYQAVLNQELTFPQEAPLSKQCQSLLKGLLNKDPKHRLGTLHGSKEVLAHPWFGKQNYQKFIEKKVKPPIAFNKLQKLNLDTPEKDKYKENLDKVLKDQKCQGKQFSCIMNNFYFDFKKSEQSSNPPTLFLRQKVNIERKVSLNKLKQNFRRSLSKESKQNLEPQRKMKKKNNTGIGLQNSLQYFFRK